MAGSGRWALPKRPESACPLPGGGGSARGAGAAPGLCPGPCTDPGGGGGSSRRGYFSMAGSEKPFSSAGDCAVPWAG